MKKKLPWLKYDAKRAVYVEAKHQVTDADKKFNEAAKSVFDATVPIEYVDFFECSNI